VFIRVHSWLFSFLKSVKIGVNLCRKTVCSLLLWHGQACGGDNVFPLSFALRHCCVSNQKSKYSADGQTRLTDTNYPASLPNSLPYLNPTTLVAAAGRAGKSVITFLVLSVAEISGKNSEVD